MVELQHSSVERIGISRAPGYGAVATREISASHQWHRLTFVFSLSSGKGSSRINLGVERDDLAAVLDEVGRMPGGTRLLAEAAARAATRLDEGTRAVADDLNDLDDASPDAERLHDLAGRLNPLATPNLDR